MQMSVSMGPSASQRTNWGSSLAAWLLSRADDFYHKGRLPNISPLKLLPVCNLRRGGKGIVLLEVLGVSGCVRANGAVLPVMCMRAEHVFFR